MPRLFAGTSGWAYPSWKPAFYPAKLPAKKFLEHYATRLNSVELNMTFRRFATEKLQLGWIGCTPPGFTFAVKAHQNITHVKRLKDHEFARSFVESLQPQNAAGRLGTVLFQLPPFFKRDEACLREFLAALPKGRYTFEFRHESWFTEAVFSILREAGAALCAAESEKMEAPDVQTAEFSYYRLRKPEYSAEERKELAAKISGKSGDVFVYFKHEETPEGALYAEELLKAVASR